jgi:hypothetical protein
MSNEKSPEKAEKFYVKYKELIVTTIICLFLSGIYDSLNTQTQEIRKWYELMLNLQADQRVQEVDMKNIHDSLLDYRQEFNSKHTDHEGRIRTLEYDMAPYRSWRDSVNDK